MKDSSAFLRGCKRLNSISPTLQEQVKTTARLRDSPTMPVAISVLSPMPTTIGWQVGPISTPKILHINTRLEVSCRSGRDDWNGFFASKFHHHPHPRHSPCDATQNGYPLSQRAATPPRSSPTHTPTPASTSGRSAASAPPPTAETMTGGGHFRHPGRRWLPCETGYFADLGVGDMPGARARPPKSPPRRRWQAVRYR